MLEDQNASLSPSPQNSGCEEENQVSRGSLEVEKAKFEDVQQSIEEVKLSDIKHFDVIPDYTNETSSLYPVIVKSGSDYHCIEGWNRIEKALRDGEESTRCLIIHLAVCDDIELAIRKMAIRVLPQGGKSSYVEMVRNCGILFGRLIASNASLAVYTHGGARRKYELGEDQEKNVRQVLSARLDKNTKTISNYIAHGNHLNPDTLEFLIKENASKRFFEVFQDYKMKLVARYREEEKLSDQEINQKISEIIPEKFSEFKKNKKSLARTRKWVPILPMLKMEMKAIRRIRESRAKKKKIRKANPPK